METADTKRTAHSTQHVFLYGNFQVHRDMQATCHVTQTDHGSIVRHCPADLHSGITAAYSQPAYAGIFKIFFNDLRIMFRIRVRRPDHQRQRKQKTRHQYQQQGPPADTASGRRFRDIRQQCFRSPGVHAKIIGGRQQLRCLRDSGDSLCLRGRRFFGPDGTGVRGQLRYKAFLGDSGTVPGKTGRAKIPGAPGCGAQGTIGLGGLHGLFSLQAKGTIQGRHGQYGKGILFGRNVQNGMTGSKTGQDDVGQPTFSRQPNKRTPWPVPPGRPQADMGQKRSAPRTCAAPAQEVPKNSTGLPISRKLTNEPLQSVLPVHSTSSAQSRTTS